MSKTYMLYMKRDGGELKDSLSDFGFAVTSCEWPDEETQDVTSRVWPGEDGEDAYIPPSGLTLKAYDLSIEFCYKGETDTAYSAYKIFRDYLRGGMLVVYDPYWKKGRKDCYAKKFSDLEAHRDNVGEVFSFKLTLRVTDPTTEIVAAVDSNDNITNIGAV